MSQQPPNPSGMANVSNLTAGYEQFRSFLERSCGIMLGDNKQYLVSSRLTKLMQQHDIANLSALVEQMKSYSSRALKEAVIDAMTTNETLWFRDTHPFNVFNSMLLPELQSQGSSPMRVWSAACSSGQEPYSLGMLVEEYRSSNFGGLRRPIEITATDLSRTMLEWCHRGEYDRLSIGRGLSPERLQRFFEQLDEGRWRVKPEVRARVRFQTLNLMDNYFSLGKFDIVFCRNVLIYFSADLKADILRRIHGVLRPGGYLILGASEGLTDVSELFEMVRCNPGIIYRAR